jgi:uncharacterized protein (TIGR02266 family)
MLNQPYSKVVRVPYVQRCRLVRRGGSRRALLCNVSVLGVYVTLDEPLPELGEELEVSFLLPGEADPVQSAAIVTWQNREPSRKLDSLPQGCGLKFIGLGDADRERLLALTQDYCEAIEPRVLASLPQSGYPRIPYVQRCQLTSGGRSFEALLCNLSVLGVYVSVEPVLAVDGEVRIAFDLPRDHTRMDVQGVVTWVNDDTGRRVERVAPGCGIRFVDLPAEDRAQLQSLVDEYVLADARHLPRTDTGERAG